MPSKIYITLCGFEIVYTIEPSVDQSNLLRCAASQFGLENDKRRDIEYLLLLTQVRSKGPSDLAYLLRPIDHSFVVVKLVIQNCFLNPSYVTHEFSERFVVLKIFTDWISQVNELSELGHIVERL